MYFLALVRVNVYTGVAVMQSITITLRGSFSRRLIKYRARAPSRLFDFFKAFDTFGPVVKSEGEETVLLHKHATYPG